MTKSLSLSAAFVIVLSVCISLNAKADPPEWHELAALHTTIREADRLGDFKRADEIASKCITLTSSTHANGTATGDYYCTYYLSSALRSGRGISRDETRAFVLLSDLVAKDHDNDAALVLAEDYLDGLGTARDPVEAGVIFWRVKHGAWSIYSNYWGMCDDCGALWNREKAVGERIDHELTTNERKQAAAIAADRFPETAARVRHRDGQIEGVTTIVVVLIGSLLWLSTRWYRRLGRSAA